MGNKINFKTDDGWESKCSPGTDNTLYLSPCKNNYTFYLNSGRHKWSKFQNPPCYLHFLADTSSLKFISTVCEMISLKFCDEFVEYNHTTVLTLPFPSLLVPTPFTKGGEHIPPSYLKHRCPHEREILQGIRDTFESLRNVKVVYIVLTWLP